MALERNLKKAKIAMVQAPDEVVGAANFTKGELNRAGSLPYEQQHIQGAWKAAVWIWKENSANMELCGRGDGPCHCAPTFKQIARNRPLDCRMSLEMPLRSRIGRVESL
jgi:hypothetical protein